MNKTSDVTIIGAGIVGVCAGLFLQRDGYDVTIVDRVEPGMSCSFGNAGIICTTDSALPLPSPGVIRDIPKMLLDPNGSLIIRWRYLLRLMPWLVAFLRASSTERRMAGARALYDLLSGTTTAFDTLVEESAAATLIRRNGMLTVYESEKGFAADAGERRLLTEFGAVLEELGADELRQMEPSLTHDLRHATYFPECYSTINPYKLTHGLAADFLGHGGRLRQAAVTGVKLAAGGRASVLETDRGDMPVNRLVIAAGAWSARVAQMMGVNVLLDAERGYHTVFHGIDTGLTRPLIHGERHFGLNQMDEGIRFAGTVELAGVDAPLNEARADNVYRMGKDIFRSFDATTATHTTKWMGCRPTMPDYLPVLGSAPGLSNVWFDFGHQHLGLSLAARSGAIIADLVSGRDPGLDLKPFRADRF
jgi:glycine/D-amino acid oxidase-like deaminating enzyme